MPLHPNYRWIDVDNGSYLHFRFKCVALVRASGDLVIYSRKPHSGRVGSVAQGKRFIERWVEKNPHFHFRSQRATR